MVMQSINDKIEENCHAQNIYGQIFDVKRKKGFQISESRIIFYWRIKSCFVDFTKIIDRTWYFGGNHLPVSCFDKTRESRLP